MNEIAKYIVNIYKSKSKIEFMNDKKGNYLQDISEAIKLGFKPNKFIEVLNYFEKTNSYFSAI